MAAKPKRHKCKSCEKRHVEDVWTYPIETFTYKRENGVVYISVWSIFRWFKSMELESHAMRLMAAVEPLIHKKD